jgi:tubulin polyglutamylase TTLL5
LQEEGDYIHDNKIPISTLATSSEIGYFYRFQAGKVKLIKCLLDENGFRDCHSNNKNWSLYWSSSPFKMEVYKSLLPYQKMNHFPNSFHLTRKDLMNKAISKM